MRTLFLFFSHSTGNHQARLLEVGLTQEYLSPPSQATSSFTLNYMIQHFLKEVAAISDTGPKQGKKGFLTEPRVGSDLFFPAFPCPDTWIPTRGFSVGGREGGRGEGCSLGSQQPQPQASALDAVGKWSLLTGSVRETAMMTEDNRREETEGKKVVSA